MLVALKCLKLSILLATAPSIPFLYVTQLSPLTFQILVILCLLQPIYRAGVIHLEICDKVSFQIRGGIQLMELMRVGTWNLWRKQYPVQITMVKGWTTADAKQPYQEGVRACWPQGSLDWGLGSCSGIIESGPCEIRHQGL